MEMLRSANDGHTLLLANNDAAVMTPNLTDVGYSPADIAPIAQIASLSTGIYVRPESGIETVEDLLRVAEENFGRMTFGSTGAGSVHHVVGEMLQHAVGKPGLFNHVPFNSGTENLAALLGGHVDFSLSSSSYAPSYAQLRMLAVSAEDGCPMNPDVPSLRSLGYDVAMEMWFGFSAPAGTPVDILDMLDAAIRDSLADPEIIQAYRNLGSNIHYMNRADFTYKWLSEYYRMRDVLTQIGFMD